MGDVKYKVGERSVDEMEGDIMEEREALEREIRRENKETGLRERWWG